MIEIGINPVAFGSLRWYGILVTLGIAALILWVAWHAHKEKRVSVDTVMIAAIVGIPSGIIVSRALHIMDLWEYYSQNPGGIIGGTGLTIYGAILGAILGIWICSKFTKFKFGYLADVIAPGLILAQTIGRIGCTINGCCYGKECSLPWAVVYTHPESFGPIGIPVHPTQVYEIIFLVITFIIILFLRGRIKPEGSLFFVYLSMYSAWRIGVGFLREGTSFLFGLHQAQVIGIIVLVIVVPILIYRTRWGRPEIEAPESDEPGESGDEETPDITTEEDKNSTEVEQ